MTAEAAEREATRCSAASLLRSEWQLGTASTYRSWLVLEQPGPWGSDALTGSRLPDGLAAALGARTARLGIRVLLIRRHGGGAVSASRRHCYLARTGTEPLLEATELARPEDVLDLDLESLAHGRSPGLTAHQGPLYLVCTHGKHDPCCAERGRPVAKALAGIHPEATWECSHLGGDRFAGNLLCLPQGLYYGRLTPDSAVRVAHEHAAGRLDLESLRGRTAYPFAVQAAEIYLRRAKQVLGLDDVRLVSAEAHGIRTAATFRLPDGSVHVVRVRTTASAPARLSCTDAAATAAPVHELEGIEPAFSERAG